MGTINQIDASQPLAFYPSVQGKIDDPVMVDLAKRLNNANLLKCEYPMEGLELAVSDGEVVQGVLDWLQGHSRWKESIEHSLQCLAEDKDGRPFLTAFMAIDEFTELAVDLAGSGILPGIQEAVAHWLEMGATSCNFEGYRIQPSSADCRSS
ncbi:TPA: hypothetical protein MXR76_002065 [Pseudomonas aeruginosa]|nr:hypothetical protein [Pseudomonas aeruginosa]HCA5864588.1 hypothetical protein [Pseudomonas aeruginosa]HCA7380107.1 hypothetical protein [Pseudomonas aeruginosa]HCA7773076.1 hypothetical protein [Pseudomonas aeruginosa]